MMTRLFGSFEIGEKDANFTILTKQKTVIRTKIVNNERSGRFFSKMAKSECSFRRPNDLRKSSKDT